MKKILSIILTVTLSITALSACGESKKSLEEEIVGTWEWTDAKYIEDSEMEFYSNGTWIYPHKPTNSQVRNTYSFSNDTLLITYEGYKDYRYDCTIDGDTMTWVSKDEDGETMVWERVNE